MHYAKESCFPVPASALWAFHARLDAFAILNPPWQVIEILQPPSSLQVGTIVRLRMKVPFLPLWQTIEAEHIEYVEGKMFADRMNKGPFAKWVHHHVIESDGPTRSRLIDRIEYELPMGAFGRLAGAAIARHQLEKLFAFRHQTTRAHLV